MNYSEEQLTLSLQIIRAAQKDLGKLSAPQRRDLLMDNTPWDRDTIVLLVNASMSKV